MPIVPSLYVVVQQT